MLPHARYHDILFEKKCGSHKERSLNGLLSSMVMLLGSLMQRTGKNREREAECAPFSHFRDDANAPFMSFDDPLGNKKT